MRTEVEDLAYIAVSACGRASSGFQRLTEGKFVGRDEESRRVLQVIEKQLTLASHLRESILAHLDAGISARNVERMLGNG